MDLRQMVTLIGQQDWLDPVADVVQQAVRRTYRAGGAAGQQIMNFLHGTWLGHPLHAVLTDVPIGAWTAAGVMDLLDIAADQPGARRGAEAAIGIGVVGAVGAALAGVTDWHHLGGRRRRIGMAHAMLNTGALAFYGTSWALRRAGLRAVGQALGFAGLATLVASAYLGGELVYAEQLGVDHTAQQELPEAYLPVLPESDLAEGVLRRVEAGDTPVMLLRRGTHIFALDDTCSHLGCSLAEGSVEGDSVRCRCHGSRFALEDGRVLDGPSTHYQPVFDVRLRNGQIEVRSAGRWPQ